MRATIGLRLLLALTLMGWGQFVLADDYYWNYSGGPTGGFSSPMAACSHRVSSIGWSSPRVLQIDPAYYRCYGRNPNSTPFPNTEQTAATINRHGTRCPPDTVLNTVTGICEAPKNCSATSGKEVIKAQTCTYDSKLKTTICEDQVDVDGCLFTAGGKKNCVTDIASGQYICTGSFYGSGQEAGQGSEPCTDESCTTPRDPDVPPADEQCVTNGDITICHKPQEEGCGSINGKEGCFQEEPGCGYFNGTYQCPGADKPNRNCGNFNGKLTCFDPKDPTKIIPESSSDHPKNGGNADGDDTNDPRPSNGTDSNPQGSDEGATNEALEGLGDKLGGKLDEGNSLLGDILGALGDLQDSLLGDDYDCTGSGEGDGIGDAAGDAGQGLADAFGSAMGDAELEREAANEQYLVDISDLVTNPEVGPFAENTAAFGIIHLIDNVLPKSQNCALVRIPLRLDRYAADLKIDVCELTLVKPLLEWIIYLITLIGLWRIAYSTLRLENAKADKGGF